MGHNIESGEPLVSVVVVNWNGLEDTKLCLEHTKNQTYSNIEIIVVDNGSNDGSVEYLSAYKNIKFVAKKYNSGFTGGHLAGYDVAQGKYILLLNNDAIMKDNYIKKAVEYLEADESVGALGGRAYFWNDTNELLNTSNDFYAYQNINLITGEGIFTKEDLGEPQEVNNVSGSCVVVRKSLTDDIGYLHDPFFAYYEESDLFARIKRAGHKVVYHPELVIWHANGKTSAKKGSNFAFYMMMRNRYRFAFRNFDSWTLIRFIKFYLKMGIVATLKATLGKSSHSMDKAYSRAFFYNAFHFLTPIRERAQLKKLLGNGNYSERIYREQHGISIVIDGTDIESLDAAVDLGNKIKVQDEVIVVIKAKNLITYAKKTLSITGGRVRICVDRGLFDVPSVQLGVACAKNEWVMLSESLDDLNLRQVNTHTFIYSAMKRSKELVVFTVDKDAQISDPVQTAQIKCGPTILFKKNLFIDAGGLRNDIPFTDSLRGLICYATVSRKVFSQHTKSENMLTTLQVASSHTLLEASRESYSQARASHYKPSRVQKFLSRHYHTQQLTNIIIWLASPHVSIRLKLARIFNIFKFGISLRRHQFATELKHIRNELLRSKFRVIDLDARKKAESHQLSILKKNPDNTPIFIICRDRFNPLHNLLDWLEAQNLRRIVLIDNNSALPPLVDFLEETDYQVLEMHSNAGHTVAWSQGIIKLLVPDSFYILSDPDVIPTMNSIDVVKNLYSLHEQHPDHLKIGLGLKIDDLPDSYELKDKVVEWEFQFWKHAYAPGVYEAGVDTTFALYKPYTYQYFIHPSLRTDEPYTARHLPWYANSTQLTDEEIFYRLRADQNINTWDKGTLPERYLVELQKQRH